MLEERLRVNKESRSPIMISLSLVSLSLDITYLCCFH